MIRCEFSPRPVINRWNQKQSHFSFLTRQSEVLSDGDLQLEPRVSGIAIGTLGGGGARQESSEARRAGRSGRSKKGYSQTDDLQPKVFRDSVRNRMARCRPVRSVSGVHVI